VATCRQHLGSENAQTGCPRHTEQAAFAADAIEVNVSEPGSARIAEVFFEWNVKRGARLPSLGAHREFFDAGDVGNRVILRHWRRGDRFQPIGMKSPVKLQNLFTNQKIARKRRHTLIVATTADGEIFWVEGLRIGERFKVKPTTTEQIAWRWRRG
jgi:tRNA(Ile)-lysidine synthetase-like protein